MFLNKAMPETEATTACDWLASIPSKRMCEVSPWTESASYVHEVYVFRPNPLAQHLDHLLSLSLHRRTLVLGTA